MDTTEKLSHISLCFGYGGIDLGLQRIFGDQLRLAAVCEIEAFAIENALAKMEAGQIPPAPIWNDLRTFPWQDFAGVTMVSGGFPCQPFSAAGKRGADADERHLFPHILRGIRECKPAIVFLENVEGIISAKLSGDGWNDPAGTPVLLHVLRELERVGYTATAGIFSASEVGAPHQRKRVFILGYSNGTSGFDVSRNERIRKKFDELGITSDKYKLANPSGNGYNGRPIQNGICERIVPQLSQSFNGKYTKVWSKIERCGDMWPSRANEIQFKCEPPRIIDTSNSRQKIPIKSKMDRNVNGVADWVDYAKLCISCDSRVDELRLLGNGVVPATAEIAFKTLIKRIYDK